MKLKLVNIRNIVLYLSFLVLSCGCGYWFGQRKAISPITDIRQLVVNKGVPASHQNVDFSLFWEVWDRLENTYLEKKDLDSQKMVYGAISGMVSALGDPYTMFLAPTDNQTSKEDLSGEFDGVGIQLGYKDGNNLAVVAPLSGMPAEKAGVKAGDLILHIKDEKKGIDKDTNGITLPEAVKLIRGAKNSEVILTFLHEGSNQPYTLTLKRETIIVPSVEVKFGKLDQGKWTELGKDDKTDSSSVAWLRLSRFGDLTPQQWDEAVATINNKCQISNSKCAGVVLDLRNNPGGYLNGAVNLASEFLKQNDLVVKQANSNGTVQEYKVERIGRLGSINLVVLINGGSASASEILAGALRDHDRAVIVGEKSFGKGTVQEALDLRNGAGLHVTTAKWLLPKGDWIHKKGITPQVLVKLDDKDQMRDVQLEKAAVQLIK